MSQPSYERIKRKFRLDPLLAGCIVAPLSSDGLLQPVVKLSEPVGIIPVPVTGISPLDLVGNMSPSTMQVFYKDKATGQVIQMQAETFLTEGKMEVETSPWNVIAVKQDIYWTMRGVIVGQWNTII